MADPKTAMLQPLNDVETRLVDLLIAGAPAAEMGQMRLMDRLGASFARHALPI